MCLGPPNFFLTFKDCTNFYNNSKEATLSGMTQKSNKIVLFSPGHEKVEQLFSHTGMFL